MLHCISYGRQNSKLTFKIFTLCIIFMTVNMIDFTPVINLLCGTVNFKKDCLG